MLHPLRATKRAPDSRFHVPVVVLSLAHTGLGIVRSLRHLKVPVIGIVAPPNGWGSATRLATVIPGPDSAKAPDELAAFLIGLARQLGSRPVLFPTRDLDLVFLDRFRHDLDPNFLLPLPRPGTLDRILNKWQLLQAAEAIGVPVPRSYCLTSSEDLRRVASQLPYPCVVKPVCSFHWRREEQWAHVGRRKAFAVGSAEQLMSEYQALAEVNTNVLIQELIPGPDTHLYAFGCYLDRELQLRGGFVARKLLQLPAVFGTGCVVETSHAKAIEGYSVSLLQQLGFSGIAEIEFKLDPRDGTYKLIEVNPRHWDWHGLGASCGVNLTELLYCDLAGGSRSRHVQTSGVGTWIAEDALVQAATSGSVSPTGLLRLLTRRKTYAFFSWTDPMPFISLLFRHLLPGLVRKLKRLPSRRPLRGRLASTASSSSR